MLELWSSFFVVGTETGKYKLYTLISLTIPLFTRVERDKALDNLSRDKIYGYIKSNPGVQYNQILNKLDVKNGTLSHHLHMLEKIDMIKSRYVGLRYRAFYTTEMKYPEVKEFRFTKLQSMIMKLIMENNGISEKEIILKLGKKQQTINYNIKMLQRKNIIRLEQIGRETYCYTSENKSIDKI